MSENDITNANAKAIDKTKGNENKDGMITVQVMFISGSDSVQPFDLPLANSSISDVRGGIESQNVTDGGGNAILAFDLLQSGKETALADTIMLKELSEYEVQANGGDGGMLPLFMVPLAVPQNFAASVLQALQQDDGDAIKLAFRNPKADLNAKVSYGYSHCNDDSNSSEWWYYGNQFVYGSDREDDERWPDFVGDANIFEGDTAMDLAIRNKKVLCVRALAELGAGCRTDRYVGTSFRLTDSQELAQQMDAILGRSTSEMKLSEVPI